jgi:anti-sigma factor (TIGR02949 family)
VSDPSNCGPDCQQALAELERYLDGELPTSEFARIQTHLEACYPCMDRASFEEQLRLIVRERCVEQAPSHLADRIRSLLATTERDGR